MSETGCTRMGVFRLQTSQPSPVSEKGSHGGVGEGQVCVGGVHWGEAAAQWLGRGWSGSPASAAYWRGFVEETPSAFAPNLDTRAGVVVEGGRVWPITLGEGAGGNSYPCSLRTQYVRYPLAEIGRVSGGVVRAAACAGIAGVDVLLGVAQAEKVVQWSSLLLSTNLHPGTLRESVRGVTEKLVERFPRDAVLVKNVHAREDAELPQAFSEAGYELITSRQIYFFDGRTSDYRARSAVKRDEKEFKELRGYEVVGHGQFTQEDVPRMADLYRQLYVEKHSRLNPRYTEFFVERAWRQGWLEFCGLRHRSGRLDGVYGCFSNGTSTSTPFIGYDMHLPQELGLYRGLVTLLLRQVSERGLLLNYSSGAGDFKRRRGGEPVIEFNAVYTRHLDPARRAGFAGLREVANRMGRPFLESRKI
jgi:hypothetical protein